MGRPKTKTDQEVLEAVAAVISRRGPVAFTLRQVARDVGLSPATLLQRFRTKRGMILALHQDNVANVNANFDAARADHATEAHSLE